MRAFSVWPARLALLLLLLVMCLASVALWRQLELDQQQRMQERIGYQARSLARQLEGTLQSEVKSLDRIARLWNSLGRLTRDDWEQEARLTLAGFPAYQSVQWLGADLQMRWLLPLRGNEAAQRLQLTPEHPNYNVAIAARDSGQQRFSNSFQLAQGGRGFVLYTPLYLKDAGGQRQFDGFLQGVFRVQPLMDELLAHLDSDNFSVSLLENGQRLYSRERPGTLADEAIEVPLQLLNNHAFSLRLSPTESLLQSLSTPLPQVVLGAGLAISLLLVAALALALENARRAASMQRSNRRLQIEAKRRKQTERYLRDSREHLQRLSQQDGLTGLYNRRFFDQQLHSEWRRLRRIGAPLALLMLDIDYFKTFNDSLGHLAGDDALRQVGKALQDSLQREGDVACRYGGEEFAIILINTGLEGGQHVAARVHELIAGLAIAHPGSPSGHLTLSIGLAVADPVSEEQPGNLIANSDQALYRAKHEGRNRTCIHTPAE